MMDRGQRAGTGRGWERHAPLTGVVAVVLWVIGAILLQSGGRADQEAAASEHLTFYAENEGKILVGAFLFGLGTLFFIWFLGSLRDRLYRGEGGTGRVSAIAWGGGLITAAMLLANLAPDIAAALTDDEVFAPAAAQALSVLGPEDRALLRLRYEEDLTQGQVAERLGIPEGTVKVRLHRVRARLRGAAAELAA